MIFTAEVKAATDTAAEIVLLLCVFIVTCMRPPVIAYSFTEESIKEFGDRAKWL